MRFIPRKLHLVLDIVLFLFLVSGPWLFSFDPASIPALVLFVTAAALLCYALLTKYELGIFKFMNFKNHLTIEFLLGLFLACAPWMLEFGGYAMTPHIAAGLFMMLLGICSENRSVAISAQEKTITF